MALNVVLKSQPKGGPKGRYQCTFAADGLTLRQGKKPEIRLPVGSRAEYLEKNKLAVHQETHRLEISVTKLGSYQNRLAKDIASFLDGSGPFSNPDNYSLPWYFKVIAAAPIGIPIMTLGGALPGAIGAGLAFACLGIAQNEEWSVERRVATSLGLVVLGYAAFIALAVLAASGESP